MRKILLIASLLVTVRGKSTQPPAAAIVPPRQKTDGPRLAGQENPKALLPTTPALSDAILLQLRGGGSAAAAIPPVDDVLNAVDLLGTAVFAFSGALTAGKQGMDLLGMIIIATITSVGGGTVRDLLIDSGTVFWMRQPLYFEICATVAAATFLLWPTLEERFKWNDSAKAICVADALGLGAFAVLGTQAAADHGLKPILWPVAGVMTATFGGVTRDVICQQKPRIMYPNRTMYGGPPLLGSCLYTVLTATFSVEKEKAALVSFLLTTCSRILSFDSPLRLPHWGR